EQAIHRAGIAARDLDSGFPASHGLDEGLAVTLEVFAAGMAQSRRELTELDRRLRAHFSHADSMPVHPEASKERARARITLRRGTEGFRRRSRRRARPDRRKSAAPAAP